MIGWLVVNEFLNTTKFHEIHEYLLKAGQRQGITLHLKTNAQLLIDLNESSDCLVPRNNDVDFVLFWDKDILLAKHLELLGYPVFNSAQAIDVCDNKAKTHLNLMHAGIPMPRTLIAPMTYTTIGYTNLDFLEEAVACLGFPLVLKECFGSFGQQVYLIHNMEMLKEKVTQLEGRPLLLQQYVASSFGKDIRIQVVGDQVVAAMYRYSENGDFRANLSIGGKMKPYHPSKEQCDLAIRCCQIIGLDFAGVDLLFGEEEEMVVCELNSNAHFKNIYDCTGVNTADDIISYIKERIQGSVI